MEYPPLYRKEPILDLFWKIWGYEVLTERNVILGDREFIFSNLNEFLDLILFETHAEDLIPGEDSYLFFNLKPSTLLAFSKRISRFVSPNLVVEIREDHVDKESLVRIREVKLSLGLKICVDDFGTGGSNVERIVLLQPDFVKIDMKVFSRIPYPCRKSALKNIVNLIWDTTRAQVILEKVENPEDLEIAGEIGVNLWQGFLSRKRIQG